MFFLLETYDALKSDPTFVSQLDIQTKDLPALINLDVSFWGVLFYDVLYFSL